MKFSYFFSTELEGCMQQVDYVPGVCVGIGDECTADSQCAGPGVKCINGTCRSLECNVNTGKEGTDGFDHGHLGTLLNMLSVVCEHGEFCL